MWIPNNNIIHNNFIGKLVCVNYIPQYKDTNIFGILKNISEKNIDGHYTISIFNPNTKITNCIVSNLIKDIIYDSSIFNIGKFNIIKEILYERLNYDTVNYMKKYFINTIHYL